MSDEPILELDLAQVIDACGEPLNKREVDELRERCPTCGDWITQQMNRCPGCQVMVVWHNSPVWRREYGSPKSVMQRSRMVAPTDEAGIALVQGTKRLYGFPSPSFARRWLEAVGEVGAQEALKTVLWATTRSKRRHHGGEQMAWWVLGMLEKRAVRKAPAYQPSQKNVPFDARA